jgi:hypothetical protein
VVAGPRYCARVFGRIIAMCAAALLTAGCGGSQARADEARAAVESFLAAVSSSDWGAACAGLLQKTREQLESLTGSSCEQALESLQLQAEPTTGVEVWGDQALVRTGIDAIFLTELEDGWRIRAAGCQTRGEQPAECELEG